MTNPHDHNPESDTHLLFLEVARLSAELAAVRMESANRLAAMRAALGASADGEADPLAYLRDELPEGSAYPGQPGGRL